MNNTTENWKNYFLQNREHLFYENYQKQRVTIDFAFLPFAAVGVENYPYGYLRTLKVYAIETTKNGDRLVTQTINPKTKKVNAPKKSTYDAIKFLIVNSDGHIKTLSLDYNDTESKIITFQKRFLEVMNTEQKKQLAKIKGHNETMKHVTFTIRPKYFKHRVTGEISTEVDIFELSKVDECDEKGFLIDTEKEKKKQEQIQNDIQKSRAIESYKAFKEL